MDDQHLAFELGADFLQVIADVVAVLRVVHHDEEHGFLAELRVFLAALAPFLDAELQVFVVFLVEHDGFVLAQLRAAGSVGKDGMLDDVLMDRLDQRVVGDGLDEDRAVVVARCGGHVDLERELSIPLDHAVVDVLDGLEPSHARIVDVMGLVIENGEFIDLADDFAEAGLRLGGLAGGLRAEGVVEEIAGLRPPVTGPGHRRGIRGGCL